MQRPSLSTEAALSALQQLPVEVVIVDRQGVIVAVNAQWRQFGIQNDAPPDLTSAVGLNYLAACRTARANSSPLAMEALAGLEKVLAGKEEYFELEYPCHSATAQRWFLMKAVPFPALDGLLITHIDITLRKTEELKLWDAARRDSLTGVLNRTGLNEAIHLLKANGVDPHPLVVVADIDGLKRINDTFGHRIGDMVIVSAARALTQRRAVVSRMGGDEFLVLLPRREERYEQTYLRHVRDVFESANREIPVSLSLGVARAPEDGITLEELVELADERMYQSRTRRV